MKSISGIIKGIVALVIVGSILLLSDLGNRTGGKNIPGKKSQGQRIYKMALVMYVENPFTEDCERGVKDYLKDLGWVDGKNFTMNFYNAQGDMSALNSIANTVSSQSWDMIISCSTPTIQALSKRKISSPIVFTNVGDPIIAGLGKSFADHNPGVTGVSTMSDFEGMVEMVRALQPGVKRIGTVYTPSEINSVAYKEAFEKAAGKFGIELVCAPANSSTEITDAAVSLAARGIDAFCQISDNLTASCISTIIKTAADARLPLYGFVSKLITQGAVAIVARDYHQAGYDAAAMVKRILDGASPVDIPFQLVTKTIYEVNPAIAAKYKISIPAGLSEKIKLTK